MRLLITGAWNCTEEQLNSTKSLGHDVLFMQCEDSPLPCAPDCFEGVICNGLFLHHKIQQFKNLKYIQLTSAGYDRVPLDYIKMHNITLHNARGVYSIPMAEYAVCGVLELLKHSKQFMQYQKQHEWKKDRSLGELYGKTVCIVGCGSIGNEVATRFGAFGCRVIGVDTLTRIDNRYSIIYSQNELPTAFGQSDVIILTLPLTEQTTHLINRQTIDIMKHGAILVNIARGQIVNTNDLISALESRIVSGAVLDVFEDEPLPSTSPLWDMDNVILTPHNSFIGEHNSERLWSVIKNNLEKHSKESTLSNNPLSDPEA